MYKPLTEYRDNYKTTLLMHTVVITRLILNFNMCCLYLSLELCAFSVIIIPCLSWEWFNRSVRIALSAVILLAFDPRGHQLRNPLKPSGEARGAEGSGAPPDCPGRQPVGAAKMGEITGVIRHLTTLGGGKIADAPGADK